MEKDNPVEDIDYWPKTAYRHLPKQPFVKIKYSKKSYTRQHTNNALIYRTTRRLTTLWGQVTRTRELPVGYDERAQALSLSFRLNFDAAVAWQSANTATF